MQLQLPTVNRSVSGKLFKKLPGRSEKVPKAPATLTIFTFLLRSLFRFFNFIFLFHCCLRHFGLCCRILSFFEHFFTTTFTIWMFTLWSPPPNWIRIWWKSPQHPLRKCLVVGAELSELIFHYIAPFHRKCSPWKFTRECAERWWAINYNAEL